MGNSGIKTICENAKMNCKGLTSIDKTHFEMVILYICKHMNKFGNWNHICGWTLVDIVILKELEWEIWGREGDHVSFCKGWLNFGNFL